MRLTRKGGYIVRKSSKKDQQAKGQKKNIHYRLAENLQAIFNAYFIFLCQKVLVSNFDEIQKLYFNGHSRGGK